MPLTRLLSFHVLSCPPLNRSLSFRVLTSPSLCGPGALPWLLSFQPIEHSRPLAAVSQLYAWPCLAVASRACSLPRVYPVAPDALHSNASNFAAVPFSAPPSGSTPAALLATAGAAHTTVTTPPHSCVPTPAGSTSSTSVLACTTVPANPRVSWNTRCIDLC